MIMETELPLGVAFIMIVKLVGIAPAQQTKTVGRQVGARHIVAMLKPV